jgi:hypothetical protein
MAPLKPPLNFKFHTFFSMFAICHPCWVVCVTHIWVSPWSFFYTSWILCNWEGKWKFVSKDPPLIVFVDFQKSNLVNQKKKKIGQEKWVKVEQGLLRWWATQFYWSKPNCKEDGKMWMVRCKTWSKVEGKEKLCLS